MDDEGTQGLRYTEEHEWVRLEDGKLRVGITSYAQDQLGDVVFVDLPEPGTQVERGQSFGEIESTKSVSDLYAPVSGVITERNEELDSQPDLVNTDPFGDGWLVTIEASDSAQFDDLLTVEQYNALLDS